MTMPSRNPKRRAARSKREGAGLDHLKPDEAAEVLRRLLAAHPDLADEAERTARSILGEVTFEEIADEVKDAVRAPDLDDLNARRGSLGAAQEAGPAVSHPMALTAPGQEDTPGGGGSLSIPRSR